MALWVGLTGPIGAGKSYVANVWKELGAGIVEGDEMGRLALQVDPLLCKRLADRFGGQILDEDGQIIRSQLAKIAFSSQENQLNLTQITFPTLYKLAIEQIKQLSLKHSVVVLDAALIFEWNIEQDFDLIVTVTAPKHMLIERAALRMGTTQVEAEQRLLRQISPSKKSNKSDFVIVNDHSVDLLKQRAISTWKNIIASYSQSRMDKA